MNVNQLTALFSRMGSKSLLRSLTSRRGRNKNWMYLVLSAVVGAITFMVRQRSKQKKDISEKTVVFKQHNKRDSGIPFPIQQLLTTEFAEDFFQSRKNQSSETNRDESGKSKNQFENEIEKHIKEVY